MSRFARRSVVSRKQIFSINTPISRFLESLSIVEVKLEIVDMEICLAGIVSSPIPCNYSSSSSIVTADIYRPPNDDYIVLADYFRLSSDEDSNPPLLDSNNEQNRDSAVTRMNFSDTSRYHKSIFDDDEEEEIDLESWIYKPTKKWAKTDTTNWLIWAGSELGHSYGWMSVDLAMPGEKLLRLLEEDFFVCDQYFGQQLYDFLHEERHSKRFQSICDSAASLESGSDYSDEESDDDSDPKDKAGSRRPRLWKFVISLLRDPKYCPEWIRWENYEEKSFRFVQTTKIARLWGKMNKKKNMTYGKFTRALRYYYTKDGKGIFVPFPERLVYKFGEKATGLETDNPNFESNHERISATKSSTPSSESLYDLFGFASSP